MIDGWKFLTECFTKLTAQTWKTSEYNEMNMRLLQTTADSVFCLFNEQYTNVCQIELLCLATLYPDVSNKRVCEAMPNWGTPLTYSSTSGLNLQTESLSILYHTVWILQDRKTNVPLCWESKQLQMMRQSKRHASSWQRTHSSATLRILVRDSCTRKSSRCDDKCATV